MAELAVYNHCQITLVHVRLDGKVNIDNSLYLSIYYSKHLLKLLYFFKNIGPHCEEQDHCANNPCGSNGRCISTRHAYRCECYEGFNGPDCKIDKNECNQWDICKNNGQCVNTYGSYK